jgi:predicted ester cyclase
MVLGEENKALVRLFSEEFWNKGNLAAADELIKASAAIFLPGRGQVSLDDFKAFAASLRDAFPDWSATTDEMVAEGARVAERWTGRGTHRGEFQGIAPTGRQVTVPGTVFYRLASGRITEFRGQFDGVALLQQLRAIPDHR